MSVAGASIAIVKALILEKKEKWFGGAPKSNIPSNKQIDPKSLSSAQWLQAKSFPLLALRS
jgi:hypothetical protein